MKKAFYIFSILLFICFLPVIGLYTLSEIHHQSAHKELIQHIKSHLGENVKFKDIRYSYLRSFPNINLTIFDLAFFDGDFQSLTVKEAQVIISPFSLIDKNIRIEKIKLSDAQLVQVIDEYGNKTNLIKKKENPSEKGSGTNLMLQSDKVILENVSVSITNKIKGNHIQISSLSGLLSFSMLDSILLIKGSVTANLDSLFTNDKPLFVNIPAIINNAELSINLLTTEKTLQAEAIYAKGLKLIPQVSFIKQGDGNLVDMSIKGEDNLDKYLGVFNFLENQHLRQVNPEAKVRFSFNQHGFINPFQRPYSEVDFYIKDAEIIGDKLPFPIKHVFISGNYNNGEKHSPEASQLQVDTLHAEIEDSYLKSRFLVSNLKDPFITGDIDLLLHLDKILENETISASGKVAANFKIHAKISELREAHLTQKHYAKGNLTLSNIELRMKSDSLHINEGQLQIENHVFTIDKLEGDFRHADFALNGQIENLDLYLLNQDSLIKGFVNFEFDKFNLASLQKASGESRNKAVFNMPDLALKLNITGNSLLGNFGNLSDIDLSSTISSSGIDINKMKFRYLGGLVSTSGIIGFKDNRIHSVNGKIKANLKTLPVDNFLNHSDRQKSADSQHISFLPPEIDIKVDVHADNGSVHGYTFNNLQVNADISDNQITVKRLRTDALNGSLFLYSDIKFNDQGIWYVKANGNSHFHHLVIEDLLQNQKKKKGDGKDWNSITIPKYIDIAIGMQADKISYRSLEFEKIRTGISFSRNKISIDEFRLLLPDGSAQLKLSVENYLSGDPFLSGSLIIDFDTLDVNKMKEFYVSNDNNTQIKSNHNGSAYITALPDNINIEMELKANTLKYNDLFIHKLNYKSELLDHVYRIDKFEFDVTEGNIDLSGVFVADDDQSVTGHMFSKAKHLNISALLSSFNNFEQSFVTSDNTFGFISWQSDYYFRLDSLFKLVDNDNLWMFDITIDNGEIVDNKPIEDALSFIGHDVKEKIYIENATFQTILYRDVLFLEDVMVNNNISNMDIHGAFDKSNSDVDVNLKLSLNDLFFRSKDKRIVETKEGVVNLSKDLNLFLHVSGPVDNTKVKLNNQKKFRNNRSQMNKETTQIKNDLKSRINILYQKAQPRIKTAELVSLNK